MSLVVGLKWQASRREVTSTLTLTFESVEFRYTSLPGYEIESIGIEMRKSGIRVTSSVELNAWL
jgi:hypothetical protein